MIQQLGHWGRSLARNLSFPRHILKRHLREFSQVIGPISLTLDVGSGRLSPYRALFDSQQYISLDYFEYADLRADAGFLPFPSKMADLVLVTEVLEHLPNPVTALTEMNRVLNTAGYLLLTVPLIWGVHDYVDYQRWTKRGLIKILTETGFEVITLKRRGGIFSTLGCMIAQIPMQVFGDMGHQRHKWLTWAYMLTWVILAPAPWLGTWLDPLDHQQDFTVGYSVLCRKK
jgi:SAM-dependent methyltransferase